MSCDTHISQLSGGYSRWVAGLGSRRRPRGWLWPFRSGGQLWIVQAGQPAADLGSGVQAELVEDVGDVGLDGALGQEQPGCYLVVAEAVGGKLGDLQFPAGEDRARLSPGSGGWPGCGQNTMRAAVTARLPWSGRRWPSGRDGGSPDRATQVARGVGPDGGGWAALAMPSAPAGPVVAAARAGCPVPGRGRR
jgi:hypothetical protein